MYCRSKCLFAGENIISILELKKKNDWLCLSSIDGVSDYKKHGTVNLKIGSRFCKDFITIKAYILSKVTSQIPNGITEY